MIEKIGDRVATLDFYHLQPKGKSVKLAWSSEFDLISVSKGWVYVRVRIRARISLSLNPQRYLLYPKHRNRQIEIPYCELYANFSSFFFFFFFFGTQNILLWN